MSTEENLNDESITKSVCFITYVQYFVCLFIFLFNLLVDSKNKNMFDLFVEWKVKIKIKRLTGG
jgi:hypothetical protein